MSLPTVFITGASTGIGLATARLFQRHGWRVIATMRQPDRRRTELHGLPGVTLLHLDVTDPASVRDAVARALDNAGTVEVLVNNAGYSLSGVFEAAPEEAIRRQYATNVFGLMEVTRALLPHFRARRAGTIVNIASVGGRIAFPFYSLYNSTKWAVEGFSEALAYELAPLNIRVRLVEPGIIRTDFYDRSMVIPDQAAVPGYEAFVAGVGRRTSALVKTGSAPEVVARVIYRAATARGGRLRYIAGADARLLLALRRLLPARWFRALIRNVAA